MEQLSSRVILPPSILHESKELQFSLNNKGFPCLFNIVVSIHSSVCPESGIIVVGGKIISKLKHVKSKDSIHTFEM